MTPKQRPMAGERRVAYVLSALELELVHRDVLRVLLPAGTSRMVRKPDGKEVCRNTTSLRFGQILVKFERRGWIKRCGGWVQVLDAEGLREYYLDGSTQPESIDWQLCLDVARRKQTKGRSRSRDLEIEALERQLYMWKADDDD